MRKSWTDTRLDDFVVHVDQRFSEVDRRFDEVDRRFDEVDRRLGEMNRRMDRLEDRMEEGFGRFGDGLEAMQRTMVHGILALSGAFMAGFAALVGLVATQL